MIVSLTQRITHARETASVTCERIDVGPSRDLVKEGRKICGSDSSIYNWYQNYMQGMLYLIFSFPQIVTRARLALVECSRDVKFVIACAYLKSSREMLAGEFAAGSGA